MSFCNPAIIEVINQGFVPLFAPSFPDDQGPWRSLASPTVEPFIEAVRKSYLSLPRQRFEPFQMMVMHVDSAPGGEGRTKTPTLASMRPRFITRWFRVQGFQPESLRTFLQGVTRADGGPTGPPLFTYRSCGSEDAGPGGLHLRMVSRFVQPPTYEQLLRFHPDVVNTRSQVKISEPAMTAPLRAWTPLTRAQAEALLPQREATQDTSREIDPALAASILKPMIAPTYYIPPTDAWIQTARLWVTPRSSGDATGLALLGGTLRMRYPGLHHTTRMHTDSPGDENWMEARLTGFIRYDVATRTIIDLQMVADGLYCNVAGDKIAYTAATRVVDGAEPKR